MIIILITAFLIYIFITNEEYSSMDLEATVVEKSENIVESEGKNTSENVNNNQVTEDKEEIAVHITGEVKKQGIIYLEKGSRVADAIKKAGGETKDADLSQINLAYILQDGQKIYVPNKNDKISQYITEKSGNNDTEENTTSNSNKEDKKVNINTANQSELDQLPGIGPSIAQKIIEYREENGNFKNIQELQNVKGIGNAKYEEIKDNVTV